MATYKNIGLHAVDVTGGQWIAPGAVANIDPSVSHEAALIAAGTLILVDPSVPPNPPPSQPATSGIPDFAPFTAYPAKYTIAHAGILYQATAAFNSAAAFSAGDWTPLSGGTGTAVSSVAGRTGAVTLTHADISGLGTAALANTGDFDSAGTAATVTAAALGPLRVDTNGVLATVQPPADGDSSPALATTQWVVDLVNATAVMLQTPVNVAPPVIS